MTNETAVPRTSPDSAAIRSHQLLKFEDTLRTAARAISDTLAQTYRTVRLHTNGNAILQLRRDVFNLRRPRQSVYRRCAPLLERSLDRAIVEFFDSLAQRDVLRAQFNTAYERDVLSRQEALRCVIRTEVMKPALIVNARGLHTRLRTLVDNRDAIPNARAAKLYNALLSYLLRAALKTSPNSSFTATALAFVDSPSTLGNSPFVNLSRETMTRTLRLKETAKHWVLSPTLECWSAWNGHARFKLNETLKHVSGQYAWKAVDRKCHHVRQTTIGTNEWATGAPACDRLTRLVSVMTGEPHGFTKNELMSVLVSGSAYQTEALAAFFESALKQQLIKPVLPVGDQIRFGDWIEQVAALLEPAVAKRILIAARDLTAELARCQVAPAASEGGLDRIQTRFDELACATGSELRAAAIGPVFHEDCHFPPVSLPRDLLSRSMKADMHRLLDLALLTPGYSRLRYWIAERFVDEFGETGVCRDPQSFFMRLHDELTQKQSPADADVFHKEAPFRSSLGEQLDDLGREFFSEVAARTPAGDPVEIGALIATEFQQRVPEQVINSSSLCCLNGQFISDRRPFDRFVLNRIYPGNYRMQSRFLNADGGGIPDELARYLTDASPTGRYAAIPGVFGFNGNLHPKLAETELVLEQSSRDFRDAALCKCYAVQFDGRRGGLVLIDEDGRPFDAYYFGILRPRLLPPVQRLIDALSGGAETVPNLAAVVASMLPESSLIRIPRLVLGSIIVSRETVYVNKCALPDPTLPSRTFFLEMQRWQKETAVSLSNFVHAEFVDNSMERSVQDFHEIKWRKPFFVDIRNPLMVEIFQRMLRYRVSRVAFVEVLPNASDMTCTIDGKPHVCELSFEISSRQTPGRHC